MVYILKQMFIPNLGVQEQLWDIFTVQAGATMRFEQGTGELWSWSEHSNQSLLWMEYDSSTELTVM